MGWRTALKCYKTLYILKYATFKAILWLEIQNNNMTALTHQIEIGCPDNISDKHVTWGDITDQQILCKFPSYETITNMAKGEISRL